MTQQPPPGPPPSGPPPSGPPPSGPPPGGAGWAGGSGTTDGMGTLVVHLQGSMLTSNMIVPKVQVNGFPMPSSYGPNTYPLAAGRWHVDVSAQWLRAYGQASIDAEVAPGQVTQVHYAAPIHQFTTGSIGFEKQKRKGWLPLLLVLGVVVALVVLLTVASSL